MKYWDIKPPQASKLVAWIDFSVTRRKALMGIKINVVFVPHKKEVSSYDRNKIPF